MSFPFTSKLMQKELEQKYVLPEMARTVYGYMPCYAQTAGGLYCGLGEAKGGDKENPKEDISNASCKKFNELKGRELTLFFNINLDSPLRIEIVDGKFTLPTIVFPKFPRGFFSLDWKIPAANLHYLKEGRSQEMK